MRDALKYVDGWYQEQINFAGDDYFGIKIQIAMPRELTDEDKQILRRHANQIQEEIEIISGLKDPALPMQKIVERAEIIDLFPEGAALYVEEIPNEYCSRPCCFRHPWFIVTTKKGRIKVGWRTRVINIDWKNSTVSHSYKELFPDQDVTKGDWYIHAWGKETAQAYIAILLEDKVKEKV